SGAFGSIDRDQLLVAYQYDNAELKLHSFESAGASFAYGGSQGVYDSGAGQFDASRARFVVGRFTRTSGPQQIAVLYQYPNAKVRIGVFDPLPSGLVLQSGIYEKIGRASCREREWSSAARGARGNTSEVG